MSRKSAHVLGEPDQACVSGTEMSSSHGSTSSARHSAATHSSTTTIRRIADRKLCRGSNKEREK